MNPMLMPVNVGPPSVAHVIRGERVADEPVCGIEVLMHRFIRLKEWRLQKASDTYWRCYWPLSHGGEVTFQGETLPLAPGWMYLIAPHTAFDSHCERPFRKWYIHFTLSGMNHPHERGGIVRIRPTAGMLRLLAQTCPASGRTATSRNPAPRTLATLELVVRAVDEVLKTKMSGPVADRRIVSCIGFMRQRLKEKLTLGRLARCAGTSARTLTQAFTTETGFPPYRYLIELRLNHAMHMLRNTDQSIEQIAEECGFGNRYYFTRMFARYRQATPGSFRRSRQRPGGGPGKPRGGRLPFAPGPGEAGAERSPRCRVTPR